MTFRDFIITICIPLFPILFSSCKKNNDPVEELPQFGTCEPVSSKGNLSYNNSNKTYTFKTSGGGTIVFNNVSIIITHKDYAGFKLEYWGNAGTEENPKNSANHENLNGKHIKDRIGLRRTFIFPDGTKITMLASGEAGPPISISIYEADQCHSINAECGNTLEYSSVNAAMATKLDDAEPDGETATFEFTATGLLYLNIYTENEAGNKIMERALLGEIIKDEPNTVNDFYDDARLGHT